MAPVAHAIGADDLLDPDDAFAFHAEAVDGETVRATWDIADGYYMYREQFEFSSPTEGIELGEAQFPDGEIQEDEFFGRTETYRHEVAIDIPLERATDAPEAFVLEARSQGCADIGVCYPPHFQEVEIALPATAASEENGDGALGQLGALGDDLGLGGQDDFLDPEVAFRPSAEVDGADEVTVRFEIADEYYLYKDQFDFEIADGNGVAIGEASLPSGLMHEDEFFGETEIYRDEVEIPLRLLRETPDATEVNLRVRHQGCADAGLCYPPQFAELSLSLPGADEAALAAPGEAPPADEPPAGREAEPAPAEPEAEAAAPAGPDDFVAEQDRIAGMLAGENVPFIIAAFFGFGLLLAFTPCVFPMIPILGSIIAGQENPSTGRSFSLSVVFVLAMALTYTVAGVLAGLFGAELNIQAMLQNPWILGTFAAIFIALALAMFGFYDLQLPSSWQAKLSEVSNRRAGGTFAGVGAMGVLSALIVGPCVAAPLAGALIFLAQTGDAVLGGSALFAMSLGMGLPLIAVGTGAGKVLPKAGPWMNATKAVFGVLLLGVAVWMIGRLVPVQVEMVLWAVLLIVSAIYMGALEPVREAMSGWRYLWKGLGVAMIIYGIILVVGASAGGSDPLQPLRYTALTAGPGTTADQPTRVEFQQVKGVEGFREALQEANARGEPVMLEFYADWCIDCVRMERTTFRDPRAIEAVADVHTLKTDVTAHDAQDRELLQEFGLIGPPAILFFGTDGEEQRRYRAQGYMDAEDFAERVRRALDT